MKDSIVLPFLCYLLLHGRILFMFIVLFSILNISQSSYLRQSIVSFSSSKNRLSSLSKLFHENSLPPSFFPDDYFNYISDKIISIRSLNNNNNNNLPTFTKLETDSLSSFSCLSISDLTEIINSVIHYLPFRYTAYKSF